MGSLPSHRVSDRTDPTLSFEQSLCVERDREGPERWLLRSFCIRAVEGHLLWMGFHIAGYVLQAGTSLFDTDHRRRCRAHHVEMTKIITSRQGKEKNIERYWA